MMTTSSSVEDALRRAAGALRGRSDSARLDAELLLSCVLGVTRSGLIVRGARPLQASEEAAFEHLVSRRETGIPVAYLIGSREFWSLTLEVSPAVLVPRPETEILIEQALLMVPPDLPRSVLDLGTGSGAIALAIATERPDWTVTGTDVSADALRVAERNARLLHQYSIRWRLGSWFSAVPEQRFDLIVTNPPYVAANDPALRDLRAEPLLALSPGSTGLEALQQIIAEAPAHLRRDGWLLLEHGQDQASAVRQLLLHHGFDSIRTCLDLSGKSRVTVGCLHITVGNL